jgi:hypothetical protein
MCDQDEAWAGAGFSMEDETSVHVAAHEFLRSVGLTPTDDAIDQLVDAFLPALSIICQRGYQPNGAVWKTGGVKGQVYEACKNMIRLRYHAWRGNTPARDTAIDAINYLGYYIRALLLGLPEWGEYGSPNDHGSQRQA